MTANAISEKYNLSQADRDRIVEMAWEDRTPFDVIEIQFGVPENEVIILMRSEMKVSSFKMWRERVQGRAPKHAKKSTAMRFKCTLQKTVSLNKISKR